MADYADQNNTPRDNGYSEAREQQAWEVDQAYFADFERRLNYSRLEGTPLPNLPDYEEMRSRYRSDSETATAFHQAYLRLDNAWREVYDQQAWEGFGSPGGPLEQASDSVPSLTNEVDQTTPHDDLSSVSLTPNRDEQLYIADRKGNLHPVEPRTAERWQEGTSQTDLADRKGVYFGETYIPELSPNDMRALAGVPLQRPRTVASPNDLQQIPQTKTNPFVEAIESYREFFRDLRSVIGSLLPGRKDDQV